MKIVQCRIVRTTPVAEKIFALRFTSAPLASSIKPGQFLNIKVFEGTDPLLRRPFSVYRTDGDDLEIVYSVIGRGTVALSRKQPGELLDVLGPLGVPFSVAGDFYDSAILVAGGLGIAPLPILTGSLLREGKAITTFVGARTASALVVDYLKDVRIATDDGSRGYHGTVIELLADTMSKEEIIRPKIYACGPTAMLRVLAEFARNRNLPCEVSLEGSMACGFGICQGCPVELIDGPHRYALMCKDGPTFDVRRIKI